MKRFFPFLLLKDGMLKENTFSSNVDTKQLEFCTLHLCKHVFQLFKCHGDSCFQHCNMYLDTHVKPLPLFDGNKPLWHYLPALNK